MQPEQTNNMTELRVQRQARRCRPAAFTLMELVVVVAICAFLLAMFVVGFKYVSQSMQANSTKATLESLKTMQANFEKATPTTSTMAISPAAMLGARAANTPTLVTADSSARYGPAITYTQAIIYRLRSIPDNLAIIQNTPSNRLYVPPLPTTTTLWTSSVTGVPYYAADIFKDPTDANVYICIQDNLATAPANQPSSNPAYWINVGLLQKIPVFLDAWNNPIIFVPAGGLLTNIAATASYTTWAPFISYPVNAQVSANVNGVVQNFICVLAHTSAVGNGPPYSTYWKAAYAPTMYRPFWVSAGPDGRFTDYGLTPAPITPSTNDNMNSFDN